MITNSPMKHKKNPGAIPCHNATKNSVMKWDVSLLLRKRSLLYKYLVTKEGLQLRETEGSGTSTISHRVGARGPFLETPDDFPVPVSIFWSSFIHQLMAIIGANLVIWFTKL